MTKDDFTVRDGVLIPGRRPEHRGENYDEETFDLILRMQRDHFWYRGRHHMLLGHLNRLIRCHFQSGAKLSAIDIGGGCGGWIEYIHQRSPDLFSRLALGDSSMRALSMAGGVVGEFASRFLVDLMDLPWQGEWDVIFLLDVLEHIPDHAQALRSAAACLKEGGLAIITAPALRFFWTYNDRLARHRRRYSIGDMETLAEETGLRVVESRYFMFLLSPLLLLSRLLSRPPDSATAREEREFLARTHRVPPAPVNRLLYSIFRFETAITGRSRPPWGTSLLSVMKKDTAGGTGN